MNELALFAGAGGGILGGLLCGFRTVCAVEINDYCRRVLMQRQDDGCLDPFPIWGDITQFDGRPWSGCVDIVTGGFPCQAFSSASRGQQTAQDLWPEMLRVIAEVAPRYVLAENVSRAAIHVAADDLESGGYTSRVLSISAADLGADHIRPRYWLYAYADDKSQLRGHVDAEMARMQSILKGVWETFPGKSGVVNGMANRVERYRAIGNGQIPGMVASAWHILSDGLTAQARAQSHESSR